MSEEREISNDVLLTSLHLALIEIRETDNIKKAKMLANIFHNVPSAVQQNNPRKGLTDLMRTARRLNCEAIAERFLAHGFGKSEKST